MLQVGRTEHLKNTLNPSFGKKVVLSYFFEEVQKICFKIYDIDNSTATLDDDDFLGESACTLGQVTNLCQVLHDVGCVVLMFQICE